MHTKIFSWRVEV